MWSIIAVHASVYTVQPPLLQRTHGRQITIHASGSIVLLSSEATGTSIFEVGTFGRWQSMNAVAAGSCSFRAIRSSIPKSMALQKASDHQAKTSPHKQANTISDHVHPLLRPAYVRLN